MGEAGQLSGAEGAGVGEGAVGLALHVALVLPLGEVPEGGHLCGVLHPLDNLNMAVWGSDNIALFKTIYL